MENNPFRFHPANLVRFASKGLTPFESTIPAPDVKIKTTEETPPIDVKLEPEIILNEASAKQKIDAIAKRDFTPEEKAKHFPCKQCQKVFFRKKSLREHMQVHTVVKKFQCDECGLLCDDPRALKSHKIVHGNKQFKCDHCHRAFARSSQLVVHLRTHTGDKPFMCEVCSMTFHDPDILRNHRKMHKSIGSYKCPLCQKVFTLFIYLKRHIRLHSGLKSFTCELCLKSFSEAGNLRKHLSTHTGEKPYMCDVCNKCFKQKKYLDVHLKIHSPDQVADHRFPHNRSAETLPPNPFNSATIPIKNPEKDDIGAKMIYQKLYEQLEQLYPDEMHRSTKKLKSKDGRVNSKQEEIEESESEDNEEAEDNKGNGGGQDFYIETDPNRSFICGYCFKGFKNIHHLNDHERTHTGEKPFSCDKCLSAFTRLSTLKKHKRVHCKFRTENPSSEYEDNLKINDFSDFPEDNTCIQEEDDQELEDDKKEFISNEGSGLSRFEFDKDSGSEEEILKIKKVDKISKYETEKIIRDEQVNFLNKEQEEGEIVVKTEKDNEQIIKKEIDDEDGDDDNIDNANNIDNDDNIDNTDNIDSADNVDNTDNVDNVVDENPLPSKVPKIKDDKKLFPCDFCSYDSSKSLAQLKIHRRIHTGEKPFLCQECPRAFAQVSALNVHKRTHTGEKPYSCDKCPMWFSLKRSLDRHQLTHSGERPFLCDLCTKTFSQINTLKRHRLTHFGIKPQSNEAKSALGLLQNREKSFMCDHCPKAFYNVHHLNDHKLTHTGEKPFSCDQCFTHFTRSSTLKKHKAAYCKYMGSQNN